jgi:hypothetical protein
MYLMRRVVGTALISLLLATAGCTSGEPNAFTGFRLIDRDEVLSYRIQVRQKRTASGLGSPKSLRSTVILDVEEEPTETGYDLVVRDVSASGESTQKTAAARLKGRRIGVNLEEGALLGDVELFSGADDLAAADIGVLHALFSPLLPKARSEGGEHWRAKTPTMRVPWSQEPIFFTVDHEVVSSEVLKMLDAARVRSRALTNIRFRLPLLEQATSTTPPTSGSSGSGQRTFIVNELFEELFSDIDNPAEGLIAAIAAIPLAIAAPFLAFGEALGGLFGDSDSDPSAPKQPEIPVVDLAGPVDLNSNTAVWRADGRVLSSSSKGTAELTGTLPQLSGAAADLSGKPLTLKTAWSIKRRLTSPWPQPRPVPGRGLVLLVLAIIAVLAGVIAAAWRTRQMRSRGGSSPVRDTVSAHLRPREPETIDA